MTLLPPSPAEGLSPAERWLCRCEGSHGPSPRGCRGGPGAPHVPADGGTGGQGLHCLGWGHEGARLGQGLGSAGGPGEGARGSVAFQQLRLCRA